mmetsp:Transcript_20584/g.53695  ORF Transcript_20584/g.53695 Transcript_20584/m.53695 type:complete len:260 (-) Transcript_20584:515-1294(-)
MSGSVCVPPQACSAWWACASSSRYSQVLRCTSSAAQPSACCQEGIGMISFAGRGALLCVCPQSVAQHAQRPSYRPSQQQQQQQQVQVQQSTSPAASTLQAQESQHAQQQQQQQQQGAQEPRTSGEALQGNSVPLGAQPCGSSGMCQALVHCSAGIGRTGTFLAIDIMIQRIRRLAARAAAAGSSSSVRGRLLSEAFNIPTLVHELRQQRMGMVQTFDQYSYIYRALQEELQDGLAKLGVAAKAAGDANAAGSVKGGSTR